MELHQIDHIARAAGAMINSSQVTFTGLASLMRTVRAPSSVLGTRLEETTRIDLLIYENHDPEGCVELLNQTMGEHSFFHEKYGYYLDARVSWGALLPSGWPDRLEYLNYPLGRTPHLLAVSPCDVVLGSLANSPDLILAMDLMLGGVTPAPRLLQLLEGWKLEDETRRMVRDHILSVQETVKQVEAGFGPDTVLDERDLEIEIPAPHGNIIPIVGRGSKRIRVAS